MRSVPALLRKDIRSALNLRRLMREQSLFKAAFILCFAAGILLGLWALFLEGFWFLRSLGGVGLMLISRLFALFFLGLLVMLFLSSVITAYTSLFGSDETAYLMLKPMTPGEITIYKLLQSAFYSSWAFFFAVIPFVGAYAWHEKLPLAFSFWTLFFSVPMVLSCAGVGMIVCLLVARWFPRSRAAWTVVIVLVVAGVVLALRGTAMSVAQEDDTTIVLTRLIPGLRVASNPVWPSWWVAEGIMSLTRGQWGRGAMLWVLLASTMLLVGAIVEALGSWLFHDAWQRVRFGGSRVVRKRPLLGRVEPLFSPLPADVRAMIMKDVRVFLRDPTQWSQGLIFFGLLGIYFLNLQNLRYHTMPPEWRNLITFLNVFSVSAVLCSFGSRFVFPQLSLEGHSFWIIGLAPTTMTRVLVSKFLVALAGMCAASVTLMLVSTRMLVVPAGTQAAAIAVAVAISFAVSGLSTGLGAVFLDLRQPNPAAIISGFGGTLNLVLSLAYMFGAIIPYGLVFHYRALGALSGDQFMRAAGVATLWLAVLTLFATCLPLILGARSLKRQEY